MEKESIILDRRYEIVRPIGEGGMGKVYLCMDNRLDIPVAVKEFKGCKGADFISEPHILKRLKHVGIPQIYNVFEENEALYMVEEYIEGITLDEYVKRSEVLPTQRIIRIAIDICDIISYLHSFNPPIIYRDLKPTNLIIKRDGSISIIDFGISRVYKDTKPTDTMYMGSLGYASPEQCGKGQSSPQTDVYGLGAVIYYMMNRRTPSNFVEPLNIQVYNKYYGEMLARIVIRAMQLDSRLRFNSMAEMKSQLIQVLTYSNARMLHTGKSVPPKPRRSKNKRVPPSKPKTLTRGKKVLIILGWVVVAILSIGVVVGALGVKDHGKQYEVDTYYELKEKK